VDSVLGETFLSIDLGDAMGKRSSKSAVGVGDLAFDVDRETLGKSWFCLIDELIVESDVELVVLLANAVGSGTRTHLPGGLKDGGEIEVSSLGSPELLVDLQHIRTTNHLVDGAEAKFGHVATKFFRNVVEEVNDLFRLAGKLGAELRVLGGDTNRASVHYGHKINLVKKGKEWQKLTVTLPHHDASHSNEGSGSESPLLGTQETSDSDVATSSDLTVSLDGYSATEIIEDQGLVSFGETELPRKTSILDTSPPRGTCTTIVARNEDMVRLGLGDTAGDDTDANFRDELHGDTSAGVGALEVVDELLQVLDRVDVMVRRGRDETDASGGVTSASDGVGNLVTRKFTTLSGLSTLSHLNLKLIGVGEII
jgi:hypothetical protein